MFGQPGTPESVPMPGVTIVRDGSGCRRSPATTAQKLWWGAGYATAEDRLFELEVFRRATTGHLAEVLGASYVPMDIEIRRDFYTPAELSALYDGLPPAFQARYTAYASGINAWVARVNSTPTDMPAEYPALGITPTHFTPEDLIAIGAYLARTTPNTDGTDLLDMQAIEASGPAKWGRILPLRIPGQIATIPRANGLFPSVPGRTPAQERAALARSYAYVRAYRCRPADNLGSEYVSGTMPTESSAAITAAGDDGADWSTRCRRSIAAGPRWSRSATRAPTARSCSAAPSSGSRRPRSCMSRSSTGPGSTSAGVTAPGAPVIAIGHNAHIAFGLTSGLSQTNALYVEHLVPGHPDEYYYRGRCCR